MECAIKPSSNLSEIVSKFAKVCSFRSIGVFSTESPDFHDPNPIFDGLCKVSPAEEDGSDKGTECGKEKVHPFPSDVQSRTSDGVKNVDVLKLFDKITALKLAYVQLQEAHVPHDPEKIKASNELVVAQFESLCKMKRAFKEKQFKDLGSKSSCSAVLLEEVQVHEKLLEKLKFQVKMKSSGILGLQKQLRDVGFECRRVDEELRKKQSENVYAYDLSSFQEIFKAASKAIHDFAKPLISLMQASGWDLDQAADSVEGSVTYAKRSHKKYVFEAYIARRMFTGMPTQSYNVDSILRSRSPIHALIEDPHSSFSEFCRTKYQIVVHPMMERSFFGNMDHRTLVSKGFHPRTPFYEAFAKMAMSVWVLQGIASSMEPKAEIYIVNRGSEFSNAYMEEVEDLTSSSVGRAVEFMVMPGFRVGDKFIKSRVYLSKLSPS